MCPKFCMLIVTAVLRYTSPIPKDFTIDSVESKDNGSKTQYKNFYHTTTLNLPEYIRYIFHHVSPEKLE